MANCSVEQYFDSIPPLSDLRSRLSRCVREAALLRKLIRLAEQRQRVLQATNAEASGGTD